MGQREHGKGEMEEGEWRKEQEVIRRMDSGTRGGGVKECERRQKRMKEKRKQPWSTLMGEGKTRGRGSCRRERQNGYEERVADRGIDAAWRRKRKEQRESD